MPGRLRAGITAPVFTASDCKKSNSIPHYLGGPRARPARGTRSRPRQAEHAGACAGDEPQSFAGLCAFGHRGQTLPGFSRAAPEWPFPPPDCNRYRIRAPRSRAPAARQGAGRGEEGGVGGRRGPPRAQGAMAAATQQGKSSTYQQSRARCVRAPVGWRRIRPGCTRSRRWKL